LDGGEEKSWHVVGKCGSDQVLAVADDLESVADGNVVNLEGAGLP